MIDLQFLAYRAEITRVVTTARASRASGHIPSPAWRTGTTRSHTTWTSRIVEMNSKINTYHVSLMARLLKRCGRHRTARILLDHAMILYGAAWAMAMCTARTTYRWLWAAAAARSRVRHLSGIRYVDEPRLEHTDKADPGRAVRDSMGTLGDL